jgi:hypothetical protein
MPGTPVIIRGTAYVTGRGPSGPVDPDYGIEEGHPSHPIAPGGERPGHGLPGRDRPVDPSYGIPLPPVINNGLPSVPGVWPPRPPHRPTYPVDPGYDIPVGPGCFPPPPVITWPPPQPVYPSLPIYIRPPHVGGGPMPGRPGHVGGGPTLPEVDNTLPGDQPGIDNTLPGGRPPNIDNTLPGSQPGIDNTLPPVDLPPGAVWPPLPPTIQGEVMCLVWIVGVGYRWTTIDPSLSVGNPIAPTPQPK